MRLSLREMEFNKGTEQFERPTGVRNDDVGDIMQILNVITHD